MNHEIFYKWVEQIKNGRTSVTDEHCFRRPVEVSTPALETRTDTLIQKDRRITVERAAEELQKRVGIVHNVISQNVKTAEHAQDES